jgi:hypothetical protein
MSNQSSSYIEHQKDEAANLGGWRCPTTTGETNIGSAEKIKMITHNTDGQASVSEPVISKRTPRIFMGFLREGGLTPEQLYAAAKSAGLTDLEYYQCKSELLRHACIEWDGEAGKFFEIV